MREEFHVIYVFFRGGGRDWGGWSWILLFSDLFIQTYTKGNTYRLSEGLWGASFEQYTKKAHVSPPLPAQYIKNRILYKFYTLNIRCVLDERRSTLVESFARRQLCRAKVRLWNFWKEWKKERKKEKQIYTESVKGKMRGRLSLVFFPPNCYFGRRNKLGKLLGQVSQKTTWWKKMNLVNLK